MSTATLFDEQLTRLRQETGAATDAELDAAALERLTGVFRRIVQERTGEDFPQDPRQQLRRAVVAVFASWNGERARLYRAHEGIPDDLGTAVNVVQMVFGNLATARAPASCFTRDPVSGAPGVYGDYLPDAQGEDVVSGHPEPPGLAELGRRSTPRRS